MFEADVGGEAIGRAGFVASDVIDFGKQLRALSDLVFLTEGKEPNVFFRGFDAA